MNLRRTFASNIFAAAVAAGAVTNALAQAPAAPAEPVASAPTPQLIVTSSKQHQVDPYLNLQPEHLAALAALCAVGCFLLYRRGQKGNGLRFMALAVGLYGMANHTVEHKTKTLEPSVALIVVDESPSQSFNSRAAETASAAAALDKTLASLPGVEKRILHVGKGADGMAADSTMILGQIEDALSDVPANRRAGIFVLSDGQIHDEITANPVFGAGVPVHALLSGKAGEYDRWVEITEASDSGQIKNKQDVKFRIVDAGPAPAGPVSVRIYKDSKLLTTKMASPGETATVSVEIDHVGANIIEIKTDPLPGEVTPRNNQAIKTITGTRPRLNVLLVTGAVNANTYMYRDLFRNEADVKVVSFLIARRPDQITAIPEAEIASAVAPFPFEEVFSKNMNHFDAVIIDSTSNIHLLTNEYLQNFVSYVKDHGGGLFVNPGPPYSNTEDPFNLYATTVLKDILPGAPAGQVAEGSFVPRVSERGQRHPVMRGLEGHNKPGNSKNDATWGPWHRRVGVTAAANDVMLEGPDKKPLLIYSQKGKGRVAMLMSDSLWRWRDSEDGKGPYSSLVLDTVRWLTKSPQHDDESLNIVAHAREVEIIQQTMADQSTPVILTPPGGAPVTLKPVADPQNPGLWRVKVPVEQMGAYKVEQTGKNPRVAVAYFGQPSTREYKNTISTDALLKPLLGATGGGSAHIILDSAGAVTLPQIRQVLPDASDKALSGDGWMGLRMTDVPRESKNETSRPIPPWILALTMAALMAGSYWHRSGIKNPFGREKNPVPGGPQ